MSDKLGISCKTTTHGRVASLEETLYSFLNQDYDGPKEMVIVNDCPFQTLHFSHPEVFIFNLKETIKSIGEKENFAVSQCRYSTIQVLDDDDIYLNNALSNVNKYFPGHQLLHWNFSPFMMGNEIVAIRNIGNSGICFDSEFVRSFLSTSYPIGHEGVDMQLVVEIEKHGGKVCRAYPPIDEVSHIYRWGNPHNVYNLSGLGAYKEGRENIVIRNVRHVEEQRKKGLIPEGDIELKPKWHQPYDKLLDDFIAKQKQNGIQ